MKALYAFSGDPITYGHIDVVERASKVFEKVVVGIGVNQEKINKYLFTLEERTKMAEKALKHLPNVDVTSFEGLLVDYAYRQNLPVVIKGVRDAKDIEFEKTLDQVGKSLRSDVDTFVMFARPEIAHISSSVAKAVIKEQGDVRAYVPLHVKQALEQKLNDQYIIGITGEIGAGKSFVSKRFEELAQHKNLPVHNIDLDKIGHKILEVRTEPVYENIRTKIGQTFGSKVRKSDGVINRKELGEIVFNDSLKLEQLNKIMYSPIITDLREEIRGKKGLISLDAALIVEAGWTYLCNNNVVFVTTRKDVQEKRLKQRGLTQEQIKRRLESQYTVIEKKKTIYEEITKTGNGKVWQIHNSETLNNINEIFNEVIKYFNL